MLINSTHNKKLNNIYSINDYVYYEFNEEELILQNSYGIVRIYNEKMKDFIKGVENNLQINIDESELKKIFLDDYKDAIRFLLEYRIIQEKKKINFNVNKIYFYTNNKLVDEIMKPVLQNEFNILNPTTLQDISKIKQNLDDQDLLIVFLNPYDKRFAKEIRDMMITSGKGYLLLSYCYNQSFYMDTLFNSEWKNPCHLCHIEHIESSLRINTTGNITYQDVIDSLYSEYSSFPVQYSLSYSQALNITTLIMNQINKFIMLNDSSTIFPEEFHQAIKLDLNTLSMIKDTSYHWELCDCYE
jgi:McbB family protein